MTIDDFNITIDISRFRLLVRFTTFLFLFSSLFTKEWFCLTKIKESIMIRIGIFRYCNEEECFKYEENYSKYLYIIKK